MKLTIENLLIHEHLEIDLQPGVNVVTGENSAGKSSVALTLSALAARHANPAQLGPNEYRDYIRDGSKEGQATLDTLKGVLTWNPLHKSVESDLIQETTALSVPHAVGIVDFTAKRPQKDLAALWESTFLPANPRSLLDGKIPAHHMDAIVAEIDRNGWPSACAVYEGKRREAGTRWSTATGAGRYSEKKASQWVPPKWRMDLEGQSLDSLQVRFQDRKDVLDALKTARAVSQAEIDRANEIVKEKLPPMEKRVADIRVERDDKQAALDGLRAEKRGYQQRLDSYQADIINSQKILQASAPFVCPSCETGLYHEDKRLHVWVEPDGSATETAQFTIASSKTSIQELEVALKESATFEKTITDDVSKLSKELADIEAECRALRTHAHVAGLQATDPVNPHELTKAESAKEEAREDLEAKVAAIDARREYDNIIELDMLCKSLSPDGVRHQEMQRVVGYVNVALGKIQKHSEWGLVEVGNEYGIKYDGRSSALRAANERLKVQFSMQIAFALLCKSSMVVLDAVDLLQDSSRAGLEVLVLALIDKNPHMVVVLCGTNVTGTEWPTTELK